ncbi:MAG TPA: hypothetical protein PKW35_04945, partial [Nannocystaceae bacterium]|nr:hypothetical protein [Nannocystaceae bacterium]
MRFTTLLRRLLGIEHLRVLGAEFEEDTLVIDVAPAWHRGRCSCCGAKAPGHDRRERRWRHDHVSSAIFSGLRSQRKRVPFRRSSPRRI